MLCVLSWLLLFPGFFTSDSLGQLAQARQGQYSDWHPPVMAWLWRQIEHLLPGKPGMLALQLMLLWTGIFLCASAITRNLAARCVLALALFFFPPVFGWAGAITKDSLMLGAALVGTGLVMRLADARRRTQDTALWGAGLAFVAVCAFRHNGLFLLAGLALLAGVLRYPQCGMRRAVATCLLLFFVPATLGQLLNRALIDTPSYPLASLLSFDISGIAVAQSGDAAFSARYQDAASVALLRPGHQLAELNRWHKPEDWLSLATKNPDEMQSEPPVPAVWDAQRLQALKVLWRELVQRYPADYLGHRLNVSLSLLAWGDRLVSDPACFRDRGDSAGAQIDDRNNLHKILGWRVNWLVQETPLLKPWLYYVLAGLLLGAAVTFRPPRWQLAAGLCVSGLLHETALFFLSPAAEYRYSAWMMVATLLASSALICGRRAIGPRRQSID